MPQGLREGMSFVLLRGFHRDERTMGSRVGVPGEEGAGTWVEPWLPPGVDAAVAVGFTVGGILSP